MYVTKLPKHLDDKFEYFFANYMDCTKEEFVNFFTQRENEEKLSQISFLAGINLITACKKLSDEIIETQRKDFISIIAQEASLFEPTLF